MYFTARGAIFGPTRPATSDAYKQLRDPYLMAYLKGGFRHVLVTVVFSLHQRKLVSDAGGPLLYANKSKDVLSAVHNTLELAVLRTLATPQRLHQVRDDRQLKNVVEAYVEPLRKAGLVADDREYRRRLPAFVAVSAVLFALAAIKCVVALGRGRSNIEFLVILAVLALAATWFIF